MTISVAPASPLPAGAKSPPARADAGAQGGFGTMLAELEGDSRDHAPADLHDSDDPATIGRRPGVPNPPEDVARRASRPPSASTPNRTPVDGGGTSQDGSTAGSALLAMLAQAAGSDVAPSRAEDGETASSGSQGIGFRGITAAAPATAQTSDAPPLAAPSQRSPAGRQASPQPPRIGRDPGAVPVASTPDDDSSVTAGQATPAIPPEAQIAAPATAPMTTVAGARPGPRTEGRAEPLQAATASRGEDGSTSMLRSSASVTPSAGEPDDDPAPQPGRPVVLPPGEAPTDAQARAAGSEAVAATTSAGPSDRGPASPDGEDRGTGIEPPPGARTAVRAQPAPRTSGGTRSPAPAGSALRDATVEDPSLASPPTESAGASTQPRRRPPLPAEPVTPPATGVSATPALTAGSAVPPDPTAPTPAAPVAQVIGALRTLVSTGPDGSLTPASPVQPSASSRAVADASASSSAPAGSGQVLRDVLIRLDPEHLGSVAIRMRMTGNKVDIRVEVAERSTLDLLDRDRHLLTAAIASLGGDAAHLSLAPSTGGTAEGGGQGSPLPDRSPEGQRPPSSGSSSSSGSSPSGRDGGSGRRSGFAQDRDQGRSEVVQTSPGRPQRSGQDLYV